MIEIIAGILHDMNKCDDMNISGRAAKSAFILNNMVSSSKSTRTILLCPWDRHFTALLSACQS